MYNHGHLPLSAWSRILSTTTKNRSVHYKRAVFSDAAYTLQSLLKAALDNKAEHADDRREQFTDDANLFRLINRNLTYSGMLCGQFVAFEPGKRQPRLTLEKDKDYYPLDSHNPGENSAYTEEIFYFGIRGNDLVCSTTRSLKSAEFETHLVWLLTTCTDLVEQDVTLLLVDKPDESVYKKVKKTSVKTIKIGTDIVARQIDNAEKNTSKSEINTNKFNLSGMGADVVRSIIGEEKFDKLSFSDDLDEANLRVKLEVTFLRKTNKEGQKAIDNIASSLRNMDGADYELELLNGGKIKGDDIKINSSFNIKQLSNGLIDENELFKKMNDWLLGNLLKQ